MNIGTYNWHKRCFDITYLLFLILFQLLPRLLTSKHRKIFSTYLVGRNGTMWNTCFSDPQNENKESSWSIKTKCVTIILLTVLRVWSFINFITWWSHKSQTFALISIRIMRIWQFLFTSKRVFKHNKVVSNLHVCSNGLGKMWPSYTFPFSTRFRTSTHTKD